MRHRFNFRHPDARAAADCGDYELATRVIRSALRTQRAPELLHLLALIHKERGELHDSLALLSEAAVADPEYVLGHLSLGLSVLELPQRDPARARRHLERVRLLLAGRSDGIKDLRHGTVLDNQKALTVRSAFLQNREYMSVFYQEGFTVLEMEAGPYLSAIYEIVNPNRHPVNEIVHLSNSTPFEVGILHYASDTPYSRRQSLLSKSLSYFGVESTYGCAIAILQRILRSELARLAAIEAQGAV